MEGAAKPKGRRRPTKKEQAAAAAAVAGAAAGAAAAAARTATDATGGATEHTGGEGATQPQPSLSQRLARSLKQLSGLGTTPDREGDDHEEVEQQQHKGPEGDPITPDDAGAGQERAGHEEDEQAEGEEEGEEGGGGRRGGWAARTAKAVAGRGQRWALAAGRRASSLLRGGMDSLAGLGRGGAGSGLSLPAALLPLLALLLLLGPLAAWQARSTSRQLSALQHQVSTHLHTRGTAHAKLVADLAETERQLASVGSRQAALSIKLDSLHNQWAGQTNQTGQLASELAQAQEDIGQLRGTVEQAAAAVAAAGAPAAERAAREEASLRSVARREVDSALDVFAADKTGLQDYAAASMGAKVVAHSPPDSLGRAPGGTGLGALRERLGAAGRGPAGVLFPGADKLVLSPVTQIGSCLPLAGTSGWIDVRLTRAIHPTAFTYEHIPASIAHDIRSAPRNLTLIGFLGRPPAPASSAGTGAAQAGGSGGPTAPDASAAGGGVPLGSFLFDARASRAVHTFRLAPSQQAGQPLPAIDHVRLVVGSNQGHPKYTCVYRLRMHGTPASQPA